MRRTRPRLVAGFIVGMLGSTAPHVVLEGQEHLTLRADLLLYGDNTEFRNPFREGETILGAALRPVLDVAVNARTTIRLGALGSQRFGSGDAFELVRPVVAVSFRGPRHTFTMGTLPGPYGTLPGGPDRTGPHGLLPPLQRETLTFERPYEAGLQWTMDAPGARHEAWINWQRLNTAAHRERFDAGVNGALRPRARLSLPYQAHVVHEGGQQFASGPVADSLAAALGIRLTVPSPAGEVAIESYALASRFVPDRGVAARTRTGAGFFGRAALSRGGWRGHLLFWRGDDFLKEEGDPNYLSIRRDGSRYRGIRDYAEAGLTRTFAPADGVSFEASGRAHRVERHYEYSYRLLCTARLQWPIR